MDVLDEAALRTEAADAISALTRRAHRAESKFGKALECLRALVTLKDAKDAGFKTYVEEEAYRAAKPKAWERARNAIATLSAKGPDLSTAASEGGNDDLAD